MWLSAGNRPEHDERLLAGGHRLWQFGLQRLERPILFAGEIPQERASLQRDVIADRAPQHWKARFNRIEHGSHRGRSSAVKIDLHIALDARQVSQMEWKNDADHRDDCSLVEPLLLRL